MVRKEEKKITCRFLEDLESLDQIKTKDQLYIVRPPRGSDEKEQDGTGTLASHCNIAGNMNTH